MKAIALDASFVEAAWDRQHTGNERHVGVKGRVETGDLLQCRVVVAAGFDHGDLSRQVLGGIARDALEFGKHPVSDFGMSTKVRSAMDEPVTDRRNRARADFLIEPGKEDVQRFDMVRGGYWFAVRRKTHTLCLETRAGAAEPVELAPEAPGRAVQLEKRELQARGTAVEGEQVPIMRLS